jgi:hypothetical protein
MHWKLCTFSGGIEESRAQGSKARQKEIAGEGVEWAYEDIVRQEGEMICKAGLCCVPPFRKEREGTGQRTFVKSTADILSNSDANIERPIATGLWGCFRISNCGYDGAMWRAEM